jgi:hypothetical protein
MDPTETPHRELLAPGPFDRSARSALREQGWLRWPGAADDRLLSRLAKPDHLPWQAMAPRIGRVTQAGWFAQLLLEECPDLVGRVADEVRDRLRTVASALPRFNEVSWQRYLPSAGHIDPHRDQQYYVGCIAILTLRGSSPFAILTQRDPLVIDTEWLTEPGEMVILRGSDPSSPERRCPLHRVLPPASGTRVTVSFRSNDGGRPWAAGLRS